MDNPSSTQVSREKITRFNFLWMSLSQEPIVALYALIPFIMMKDLKASAVQVSLFLALKPTLSVLTYFWNAYIKHKHPDYKRHLKIAWALAHIPFLIYPPLGHIGYLFVAASLYQIFFKAAMPPFYEIFKQNISKIQRQKLISNTYVAAFLISALMGLFFGKFLDKNPANWKIAAGIFAAMALSSLFFQKKLSYHTPPESSPERSGLDHLFQPLKQSFHIIKSSKEFRDFQVGFMIGGSALMLIGPAATVFFTQTLSLSHETFTQARYIYMSLGIIGSNMIWKKLAKSYSLNELMPWATLGFGLYPLVILLAYFYRPFLDIGFVLYGVAQAGSHLVWNISGTIFSKDQDSTPYTSLNILMQGIRGCIFPFLGGILSKFFGPFTVLILGALIAFWGMWVMIRNNKNRALETKSS